MVETRSRNGWVIWLSLVLALLLSVAPMPAFLEAGRPLWLALFLTYWALALPHRVGMVAAWLFGLFADVLYGSLLGQNALVLMLTTFFVTLHRACACSRCGSRVWCYWCCSVFHSWCSCGCSPWPVIARRRRCNSSIRY